MLCCFVWKIKKGFLKWDILFSVDLLSYELMMLFFPVLQE